MQRRDFLLASCAASALLKMPSVLAAQTAGKTVVLVELSGANDALNMVAPVGNDRYFRLRPRIGLQPDQRIDIDPHFALNGEMSNLARLYQDGELKIFHNVGYPKQNHSHFRSIEIWERGGDGNSQGRTGWMVDDALKMAANGRDGAGAYLGGTGNIFHGGGGQFVTGNFNTILRLVRNADKAETGGSGLLAKMRQHRKETHTRVEKIGDKLAQARSFSISGGALGSQLADVLRLIDAGIDLPVYKVTQTGYDTHVEQNNIHRNLLRDLDRALGDTYRALARMGRLNDVVVMTYSEFGRRVRENGARGTDHGSAASHLMIGGALPGGHIGRLPDLDRLDGDNLKFDIDYRSLYAWILSEHLDVAEHKFQAFQKDFVHFSV